MVSAIASKKLRSSGKWGTVQHENGSSRRRPQNKLHIGRGIQLITGTTWLFKIVKKINSFNNHSLDSLSDLGYVPHPTWILMVPTTEKILNASSKHIPSANSTGPWRVESCIQGTNTETPLMGLENLSIFTCFMETRSLLSTVVLLHFICIIENILQLSLETKQFYLALICKNG